MVIDQSPVKVLEIPVSGGKQDFDLPLPFIPCRKFSNFFTNLFH
jgi:hypothetical protein